MGSELSKETLLFPIFALLTPKSRWQIMSCGHVIVPKLLGRGEAPFELENSPVNHQVCSEGHPFSTLTHLVNSTELTLQRHKLQVSGQNHNPSGSKFIALMDLNLPCAKIWKEFVT